jgi:hypothetical protein
VLDLISPEHYGTASEQTPAIGPHFRHCIDHYLCLLRGLDSGEVDYDARDRDERIERDPERFREVTTDVIGQLTRLNADSMQRPIRIGQLAAPESEPSYVASTLARELLFLSGHTIHHLAIVSLIARMRGIHIPERVSVAYSTAAYRATAGQ